MKKSILLLFKIFNVKVKNWKFIIENKKIFKNLSIF